MPENFGAFSGFVVFAFITSITPGPNNLIIMATASSFGWRRTIPFLLGMEIGFALMVLVIGLGAGAVLQGHPLVLRIAQWAGAAWLLYLAWNTALSVLYAQKAHTGGAIDQDQGRPMNVFEAAVFQWVNPKAWAMVAGASAAFSGIAEDPLHRALIMAGTFVGLAPFCFAPWVVAGAWLRRFMVSRLYRRFLSLLVAALLVATAIMIAMAA